MANLTKKEKKVIKTLYKKHGARLQALKIKKVRTMQGQYTKPRQWVNCKS